VSAFGHHDVVRIALLRAATNVDLRFQLLPASRHGTPDFVTGSGFAIVAAERSQFAQLRNSRQQL